MCWYKLSRKRLALLLPGLILLLGSIQSCKQDSGNTSSKMIFFDLKDYFRTEAKRLAKLDPVINKTAVRNATSETKKVHIPNWETELNLFAESDINKPAWKASYNILSTDDFLIYKALDTALILRTRKIVIKRSGDKILWILIYNHTKNKLYETTEKLSYFPDSLYLIEKMQRVRLLGTDRYRISGAFN